MRPKQKQALQLGGAILIIAALFTLVFCSIPQEALLDFGKKAALLSAGIQRPEGGAQILSERLDKTPAAGTETQTGKENASSGTSSGSSFIPSSGLPSQGLFSGIDQQPDPWMGLLNIVIPPISPPAKDGSGGIVSEQKMSVGSEFFEGVAIRNKSGKSIDIEEQLSHPPAITIRKNGEPQVLIMHTHTTEAYMEYYAGYYNQGDGGRNRDNTKNVVYVGDVLAAQLEAGGIGVLHDTTVHDYPQYTGAYDRSAETVSKILEKYPSIQVVIDLHRDGIMLDDTTRVKPTVEINGRKAAQIMIITGVVSTDALPHPYWQENLPLTLRIQQAVHTQYEGLIRPLSIGSARYNQHLSKGAMLIEMGSEANTLGEAVYSAQLLGKVLVQVLGSLGE